ncbi:hypothetical protein SEA_DALANDE_30 [Gordonia phage DalanDe]|nr:hypothetical protein SEA_DALANDE_30 [Gordonia phage DalanDe]
MSIYSTPPDEPASDEPFVPGSTPQADRYDKPEGSQRYAEQETAGPIVESEETLYLDVDDPEYAYTTAPLATRGPHDYANLAGTDFTEEDDYISIPESEEG